MNIWNKIFFGGLSAAAVGGVGSLVNKFFGGDGDEAASSNEVDDSLADLDAVDNATGRAAD